MIARLLASLTIGILGMGMDLAMDDLYEGIGMNISAFVNEFPMAMDFYEMLQAVAVGLVFGIGIFQLLRFFTGRLGELRDTPVQILCNMAVAVAFIYFGNYILMWIVELFRIPYQALIGKLGGPGKFSFASMVEGVWEKGDQSLLDYIISFFSVTEQTAMITAWAVCIILIVYHTLKIVLEIIERYIVLCVLIFTSPLAWATLCSSATRPIFKKWMSMFISACLLLLLGAWFLMMMFSILEHLGAFPILETVLFVALSKVAQKTDNMLQTLGLSPAITGSSLLDDIVGLGAWSAAASFGRDVLKGGSRVLGERGAARGASAGAAAGQSAQSAGASQGGRGQIIDVDAQPVHDAAQQQQENHLLSEGQKDGSGLSPDAQRAGENQQQDTAHADAMQDPQGGQTLDGENTEQLQHEDEAKLDEMDAQNADENGVAMQGGMQPDDHDAESAMHEGVGTEAQDVNGDGVALDGEGAALDADQSQLQQAEHDKMDDAYETDVESSPLDSSSSEDISKRMAASGDSAARPGDAAPINSESSRGDIGGSAAAPASNAPVGDSGRGSSQHYAEPSSGGGSHESSYHESSSYEPSHHESGGSGSGGDHSQSAPMHDSDVPHETTHTEKTVERYEVTSDHEQRDPKVDVHIDKDDLPTGHDTAPTRAEEPYRAPAEPQRDAPQRNESSSFADRDFGEYSAPLENSDD